MDTDDLRFTLTSPQAYVLSAVKAKLTGDQHAMSEIFDLIEQGDTWRLVAVVALAELSQEIAEHRGEDAKAWLDARLQHGLDP